MLAELVREDRGSPTLETTPNVLRTLLLLQG